jgi:hypothetical protein
MAAQAIEKAAKFDLARAQAEWAKSESEKEKAIIESNNLEFLKINESGLCVSVAKTCRLIRLRRRDKRLHFRVIFFAG